MQGNYYDQGRKNNVSYCFVETDLNRSELLQEALE